MKVQLATDLTGISSIDVVMENGTTVQLRKGQPAIISDPNRQLRATIERLPVDVIEEDEDQA
jgi:hypothetical protein